MPMENYLTKTFTPPLNTEIEIILKRNQGPVVGTNVFDDSRGG